MTAEPLRALVEKWGQPMAYSKLKETFSFSDSWVDGNNAGKRDCARELEAALSQGELLETCWIDGAPKHPWDKEWFIAVMESGDRVVLTALPKEYTYDFKTADETYVMRAKVKKWRQFPDSQFVAAAHASQANSTACGRCGSNTGEACDALGCGYLNAGNGAPAAQVVVSERRSTHHVHRRDESLPCYCAATIDHAIGKEAAAAPAVVVDEAMVERACRAICAWDQIDPDEPIEIGGVKLSRPQWTENAEAVRIALTAALGPGVERG